MRLYNLFESFYSHLSKRDFASEIAQFAFGLGKQLHSDFLPLDRGLVVQVFPDAIELSGRGGEVRLEISENAITIDGNPLTGLTDTSGLWEVGNALLSNKRHGDMKSKGLSDSNLIERIKEEIRKSLGLS